MTMLHANGLLGTTMGPDEQVAIPCINIAQNMDMGVWAVESLRSASQRHAA